MCVFDILTVQECTSALNYVEYIGLNGRLEKLNLLENPLKIAGRQLV